MAVPIYLKRGLSTNRTGETPALGEPLYDTDTGRLYIGDGVTAGGNEIPYSLNTHTHDGLTPAGGTAGQVLTKDTATDYDYSWQDAASGGITAIADATDTDFTGISDKDLMRWDSAAGDWVDISLAKIGIAISADPTTTPLATGTDSFAVGHGASAAGLDSIAIGSQSDAHEYGNIAIGRNTVAGQTGGASTEYDAVAVGASSKAYETATVAIGVNATAGVSAGTSSDSAIAIGNNPEATAASSISIGSYSNATSANAVALGANANAINGDALALGNQVYARGVSSIAVGDTAVAKETNGISIGPSANSGITNAAGTEAGAISIGWGSNAYETESIAMGRAAVAGNTTGSITAYTIALGSYANARGLEAIAIGRQAYAYEQDNIAIGSEAYAGQTGAGTTEAYCIAIGDRAKAYERSCISLGVLATTGKATTSVDPNGIAIGSTSLADAEAGVALGHLANARALYAIAIGREAYAYESSTIAIGYDAIAGQTIDGTAEADSVSIGASSRAYEYNSVSIGPGAVAGKSATSLDPYAVALGSNALADASGSTALGYSSQARGNDSISIGNGVARETDCIAIGRNSIAGQTVGGATETYALAVGVTAYAYETYCVAIGNNARAGNSSTSTDPYGVALGYSATASGERSVAIGPSVQSTVDNEAHFGTSNTNKFYMDANADMHFAGSINLTSTSAENITHSNVTSAHSPSLTVQASSASTVDYNGGDLNLYAGNATGGTTSYAGDVTVAGGRRGTLDVADRASITCQGNFTFSSTSYGGNLTLQAGQASAEANSGYIALRTHGTERMRVLEDGTVGIGTSSPGTNNIVHITNDGINNLMIESTSATDNEAGIRLKNTYDTATQWNIKNTATGTFRISKDGSDVVDYESDGSGANTFKSPTGSGCSISIDASYDTTTTRTANLYLKQDDQTSLLRLGTGDTFELRQDSVGAASGPMIQLHDRTAAGNGRARIYGSTNSTSGTNVCIDFYNGYNGTAEEALGVWYSDKDFWCYGAIGSTGTCCSSDLKLKENLSRISDSGEILDAISGQRFTWKERQTKDMGVIAQEVEKVAPELVTQNRSEEDPHLTLNYNGLIAVLIEEVKSLRTRVAELEAA